MTTETSEYAQPYQQVMHKIREGIRTDQFRPGDKLPSARKLASDYGVAIGTVQRALSELRQAGVVYGQQGRGTFVRDQQPADEPDLASRVDALERQLAELLTRVAELESR